ncbi:YWFCY domain-containing protein [Chitinophaga rhizophila]|uniref:YWFCY domain-containing protein n=1 Tax=Chitinophaga rhizophila TaxID=2866212 RepID=A0ABS7G8I4_9BACT|nr:YWFCY domain-containing protein [Chitinophaga rhizophila]MBW8683435.1 YWFCY domain-containing protein [Chitinophaga rhizophila]
MSTGENEQALRKIIDFTRMGSILILAILFYISCYGAFEYWTLTSSISDRIMISISHLAVFKSGFTTKTLILFLLAISLIGSKGKKDEKLNKKVIIIYIVIGVLVFYLSELILFASTDLLVIAISYMLFSSLGYILALTGGTWLSRLIKLNMQDDVFNNLAETFKQEERLLENEYSFNFKAKYNLKGKIVNSWINIINPFRAILIYGTAGSVWRPC